MAPTNLRVREADWTWLRRHCVHSFRGAQDVEYGALGLLGRRSGPGSTDEYILTRILEPRPGEIVNPPRREITFTAPYLRRAHLAMRREGLAGIVTVHTHPHATDRVSFSMYDDDQDPELIGNLQDIAETLLLSVVLGRDSQQARVWLAPDQAKALTTLVVVGRHLRYLPLDGTPPLPPPTVGGAFDSASALTDSGALALLAGMTIAVVGVSGTGSLTCELLARAGCRRIIVIDPDRVEERNLNRILYATKQDALDRTHKVDVIKRGIEGLGLGCEVIPIRESILDRAVLARLAEADLVFGCIDKDFPRVVLCQYAYQHLIPLIDLGTEIGATDGEIVSTDARVNYVVPGRPCLRCSGLISRRRLRLESMTSEERDREVKLGYSDDLLLKQPAVMDLNMRAASAATMLLRHLLQPYLLEPYPTMLAENMVTYTLRPVAEARARTDDCDICQTNRAAGFGDCGPPLGLPSTFAARLLG